MRFLARLFLNGCAILVAAWIIPGLHVATPAAAFLAGVLLGFINALVKPVLFIVTLPLTFLTLGLFLFVLNAICLALTAALVPGFRVDGFGAALLGALVVTVVGWILNRALIRRSRG